MSEEGLTVWTIGHSTRTLDRFLDLLSVNAIEVLADVRRFPASRKYPHFDQDALRNSLLGVGVEYAPLPELAVDGDHARIRTTLLGAVNHSVATRTIWRPKGFAWESSDCWD